MGFLNQAKDLYKMQRQAKDIKSQLKNIHVEAEVDGVIITVDGEQHFVDVKIPESRMDNAEKLGKIILEAANKGVKKAQQIAAEKMKAAMPNLGSLFGGQQ